MNTQDKLNLILDAMRREYARADIAYPAYHSMHEGAAVIREEFDELWDCVKRSKSTSADGVTGIEALQVATTAVRFILDLCNIDEFAATLSGFERTR